MALNESREARRLRRARDRLVNRWLDEHYFDSSNDAAEREDMLRRANAYADRELNQRRR